MEDMTAQGGANAGMCVCKKEPWLAVCLSTVVPGWGQVYGGRKLRGVLFLIICGVLYVLWYVLVAGAQPFYALYALGLIISAFVIWMFIDAYRVTKRSATGDFGAEEHKYKDPWKAVFFSWLICGLGYFFVGRKLYGCAAIAILIALRMLVNETAEFYIEPIVVAMVCFHGYVLARGHMQFNRQLAAVSTLVVCIAFNPLGLATAYTLRYAVVEAFAVNSPTMEPAIMKGDKVIGNKVIYRYEEPKAGDSVVVKRWDYDMPFVRRVVAVGGEEVRFEGAVLYVSGVRRDFEGLDYNGIDLKGRESAWHKEYGMGAEYTVPQGEYYVIGDNLLVSWDSRNFGAIGRKDIVGKVTRRYWPIDRLKVFR